MHLPPNAELHHGSRYLARLVLPLYALLVARASVTLFSVYILKALAWQQGTGRRVASDRLDIALVLSHLRGSCSGSGRPQSG